MAKFFKISGLLLTIFSLSACQKNDDSLILINEEKAISYLSKVSKSITKNIPKTLTIVNSVHNSIRYDTNFESPLGIEEESELTETTYTFDFNSHYFSLREVTTYSTRNRGEVELKQISYNDVFYYIYFKDNLKYNVTHIYSKVQDNTPEPSIEEIKIYTTQGMLEKEFDKDLEESLLSYLTIGPDTDTNDFFSHMRKELLVQNCPAKSLDVKGNRCHEYYLIEDGSLMYDYSILNINLRKEDINLSLLEEEDKNVLDNVWCFGSISFKLEDNFYATIYQGFETNYQTSEYQKYKTDIFETRVNTERSAFVYVPDLSDYTKK